MEPDRPMINDGTLVLLITDQWYWTILISHGQQVDRCEQGVSCKQEYVNNQNPFLSFSCCSFRLVK